MTVKELIEKLKEMPENATVFTYANEDDDYANEAKYLTRENFDKHYKNPEYPHFEDYYCQGDCVSAIHLNENPEQDGVVVIF